MTVNAQNSRKLTFMPWHDFKSNCCNGTNIVPGNCGVWTGGAGGHLYIYAEGLTPATYVSIEIERMKSTNWTWLAGTTFYNTCSTNLLIPTFSFDPKINPAIQFRLRVSRTP